MSETITPPAASQGSSPAEGTVYWRSIEQLENSPEFQGVLHREFPEDIAEAPDEVSRRGFLSAVAASVALAGLTSCRKPVTHILPFNKRPEGFRPGIAAHYATTFTRNGYGIGVLCKSSDGRPTKVEGNPLHPMSMGASDAFLQAELLGLYDPARSRTARGPSSVKGDVYDAFHTWWGTHSAELMTGQGAGMHVLLAPSTSPTQEALVAKLTSVLPKVRFHAWESVHRDQELKAAATAFGKALDQHVDFSKADVVVALDSDFLGLDGPSLRSARQWASRRKLQAATDNVSRLYALESTFSTTGTMADHRFRVRAQDVAEVAKALAAELGVGGDLAAVVQKSAKFTHNGKNWVEIVAKDLNANRGKCVVVAGPRQPAAVQALVHAINAQLGALGTVVNFTATPASVAGSRVDDLTALANAIGAGEVKTLVIAGSNPAYDAPANLQFAKLLADGKVANTVHLGGYDDETGQLCQWHFPLAHELEAWGDARAYDGSLSVTQPLVAPLHGGLSAIELLGWLCDHPALQSAPPRRDGTLGHEVVRETWKAVAGAAVDFESLWATTVHDGVLANSASAPETVNLNGAAVAAAVREMPAAVDGWELVLRADSKMWDGRYANNSWMQELPENLTKLVWDNALLMSARGAEELGVANGDLVTVAADGGSITAAAWVLPGHAEKSLTIGLGWGRRLGADCKVAKGAGFDAGPVRTADRQWIVPGVKVSKAGGAYKLVSAQDQGTMAGRAIVREATKEEFAADPLWAPKMSPLYQAALLKGKTEDDINKSLWEERGYLLGDKSKDPEVAASPYQWGMAIDLNACTGCSACVVACASENNIPMVGKTQMARGREMFWLRTDRYFTAKGTSFTDKLAVAEDPKVAHMPVPCMQCENAPCESVCPVGATMHSPEGLNDMAYNRCIGTRYCSNNCPYKVRRFNYLDYVGDVPDTRRMAFNPDVTIRNRGVIEKCTYCVQRINGARITAKLQKRLIQDGEVQPACGQACPTQAIAFGNLLDPNSKVSKLKQVPLNYGVLSDLNTKPRTTYLGRIRNINPELS